MNIKRCWTLTGGGAGCIMSSVMDPVLPIGANGASCRLIRANWQRFISFFTFSDPGTVHSLKHCTYMHIYATRSWFYTSCILKREMLSDCFIWITVTRPEKPKHPTFINKKSKLSTYFPLKRKNKMCAAELSLKGHSTDFSHAHQFTSNKALPLTVFLLHRLLAGLTPCSEAPQLLRKRRFFSFLSEISQQPNFRQPADFLKHQSVSSPDGSRQKSKSLPT